MSTLLCSLWLPVAAKHQKWCSVLKGLSGTAPGEFVSWVDRLRQDRVSTSFSLNCWGTWVVVPCSSLSGACKLGSPILGETCVGMREVVCPCGGSQRWWWLDVGVSGRVQLVLLESSFRGDPLFLRLAHPSSLSQEHWAPGHSKVIWGSALRFIPVEGTGSTFQLSDVD